MIKEYIVTQDYTNSRIDIFISDNTVGFSREKLKEVFAEKKVLLGDVPVKPSKRVQSGDIVTVELPEVKITEVTPQNIPIDITYEDDDIIIVNKPQGMVVHPAAGNYENTLVNALLYHAKNLSDINGVIRPGIVHRIDKDTSGLLVVAKNNSAHLALSQQFAVHSITREYRAFVHGMLKAPAGKIDAPIGRNPNNRLKMAVTQNNSKNAVTHYKTIKTYPEYTFISVTLETGRTHQIRVHMDYIGHPVVGDRLYGKLTPLDREFNGQLLNAHRLGFIHPTKNTYVEFCCDEPIFFSWLEK